MKAVAYWFKGSEWYVEGGTQKAYDVWNRNFYVLNYCEKVAGTNSIFLDVPYQPLKSKTFLLE